MNALTPDRMPDGWSRVAAPYDELVAPMLARFAEDALAAAAARPGERILDVAAGSGALALIAAAKGAHVTAVDFAPGMVDRLRERARKLDLDVRADVMDGQALDLPDDSFDAAFSNFGLIFFPDRAKGFREMRRVLRDGGRAAVTGWSTPNRIEWFHAFSASMKEVAPDLPPPPSPPAVFSLADKDAFAREMRDAGFRDVRVQSVTHAWTTPSVDAAWQSMTETNPVIPAMVATLGEARMRDLRTAVLAHLQEFAADDGSVSMKGEAHVGVGVK